MGCDVSKGAVGRSTTRVMGDLHLSVVAVPQGRLLLVLNLTFAAGRIAAVDVVAEPERLTTLDLSTLQAPS
jgi:hypothetical protein